MIKNKSIYIFFFYIKFRSYIRIDYIFHIIIFIVISIIFILRLLLLLIILLLLIHNINFLLF